jgi:hypothetical protein
MKHKGLRVELVTEVAKFYTYEANQTALKDQFLLLAQQEYRQRCIAEHGVDWIITDSPPMLGLAYASHDDLRILSTVAEHFRKRYVNYDILLTRDASRPYETYGRNESEAEAHRKDEVVRNIFKSVWLSSHGKDDLRATEYVVEQIYSRVMRWAGEIA